MAKNNSNKAFGGFPPIILCEQKKKEEEQEQDSKIRGFSKNDEKIVVSLKEIMGERRKEEKPFIEL